MTHPRPSLHAAQPPHTPPRDLRLWWLRPLSALTVLALLPLPWAANCDGVAVTGLDAAADDPGQGLVLLVGLALAAGLMLVARRVSHAGPRVLLHLLAATAAAQALVTVLSTMALTNSWYGAGAAAVALISLALVDGLGRAVLGGQPHWRALLDDRILRWPLIGALVLAAAGAIAALVTYVASDDSSTAVALTVGLLVAPGAIALAIVPLLHRLLTARGVADDAIATLTLSSLGGAVLLLLWPDPKAWPLQLAALVAVLSSSPLVLRPVLRALRG